MITGRRCRQADSVLDDFWVGDEKSSEKCDAKLRKALSKGEGLGIDWKHTKTIWATTLIIIMGFLLNLTEKWMSLPPEKSSKIVAKISNVIESQNSLHDLQSLLGSLNWFAMLKPHTRMLHHNLIADMKLAEPISISAETATDLLQLKTILIGSDNKTSLVNIIRDPWHHATKTLWSDASLDGLGAFYVERNEYFSIDIRGTRWCRRNIAELEFLALIIAILVWSDSLRGHLIINHEDNTAVEACIVKKRPKADRLLPYCRAMVNWECSHNAHIYAVRCDSDDMLADKLSRNDTVSFNLRIGRQGQKRIFPLWKSVISVTH